MDNYILVRRIQNMMKELVTTAVKKHNIKVDNNNDYNAGIITAYDVILSTLYNNAKAHHIPLNYLSLHLLDPEAVMLSSKEFQIDTNFIIPIVKDKYLLSIEALVEDATYRLKKCYEDSLNNSEKSEYSNAVIKGYEEILELFKKHDIEGA